MDNRTAVNALEQAINNMARDTQFDILMEKIKDPYQQTFYLGMYQDASEIADETKRDQYKAAIIIHMYGAVAF